MLRVGAEGGGADVSDTYLDFDTFAATLRAAPKGGGADVLSFTYELLQALLGNAASTAAFFNHCDNLARAHCSDPIYDVLPFSKLTHAKKRLKGKLRPLMCVSLRWAASLRPPFLCFRQPVMLWFSTRQR